MDFNHEVNKIEMVQDNQPVTRPECDLGFTKRAELKRHIMSVHLNSFRKITMEPFGAPTIHEGEKPIASCVRRVLERSLWNHSVPLPFMRVRNQLQDV